MDDNPRQYELFNNGYGRQHRNIFRKAFLDKLPPQEAWSFIMSANEILATSLAVTTNIVVVMVFIRVLGVKRETSKLLVHFALVCIVAQVSQVIHTWSIMSGGGLSRNHTGCKLMYFGEKGMRQLLWSCIICMTVERIMVTSIVQVYQSIITFLEVMFFITPWFYLCSHILVSGLQWDVLEVGEACTSHNMYYIPYVISYVEVMIFAILLVLTIVLILTNFLHAHQIDDPWESNRLKMEGRYTSIVAELGMVTILLWFPAEVNGDWGEGSHHRAFWKHITYQIAIYSYSALFFVLLVRKEFRNALRLTFLSSLKIHRSRQVNLLHAAKSERTRHSMLAPKSATSQDVFRTFADKRNMITRGSSSSNINVRERPPEARMDVDVGGDKTMRAPAWLNN